MFIVADNVLSTDIIAAVKNTMPNILYPTVPAAILNASATGFLLSNTLPVLTTPRTAKKRKIRTIEAPIPKKADLFVREGLIPAVLGNALRRNKGY